MAEIVSGGRVAWLYQARRVATQANGAGGAIKVDISLATGQCAILKKCRMENTGTHSLTIYCNDEDNAAGMLLASVASGASRYCNIPSIGSSASATANIGNSTELFLGPGQKLSFEFAEAGIQNDTMTIAIDLLLLNVSTEPTWSKARSVNEADVTLAASTISAANTSQLVLV